MTDLANYETLSFGDLVEVCQAKGIDTDGCDADGLRVKLTESKPAAKPARKRKP